jgi:hypothetical protein
VIELGRALLLSDAVTPEGLARALFSCLREKVPIERALVETGAIDERRLQDELSRWDGPFIQNVVAVPELVAQLPKDACKRLLALPIRRDPRTGTVDVAVADGRNPHPANEIGFHLRAPVRTVRAKLSTLIAAIDRLDQAGAHPLAPPLWVPPSQREPHPVPRETPMWAAPIVSLGAKHDSQPPSAEMPIPLLRRSSAPDTVREPEPTFDLAQSSRHVRPQLPLPEPTPVLERLRGAGDRDAIISIVLGAVRAVAGRVAIIVVKRDAFVGWSCTPELGSAEALRHMMIPTSIPSVLARAAQDGTVLGPIPDTPAHEPLRAVMGKTSPDVAITPVKVAGRPVLLIVADNLADPALSTKQIDLVAAEAGLALARVIRKRA